ncbi:MAG: alpha/beta fold hydrolase [Thermoplasmata archaeon]
MDPAADTSGLENTTPGAPLPPGVSERFLEAGGVRFRYLQGGATTGLPLILLHGWPTWAEVWLPVLRVLGPRHPWMAPDLPCQNQSSLLPGKDRSLTAYRRAVDAFVDALDLPQFAVIGNSMGGSLAIMLALDRPDRVARLAVLDAAGLAEKLPGRTARMYLPFLLPCFLRAPGPNSVRKLLTKAVFHDPRFANDAWVNSIVSAWKAPDRRKAFIATGFALRRHDASVSTQLGDVHVPTLVLSGRHDVQFPWQSADQASRRIPGARFAAIEEAGHFPMVERPQETAKLLSDFLDADGSRNR